MSSSTQDVFDPVTYKLTLILHTYKLTFILHLVSLPMRLGQVTLFFSILPGHESRDSCFQFLVFPQLPYSHGSGQSHAWQTKSKCRHFPSPRVPNRIILSVTEWWGCLAGILNVHWTCTFWKAFNFYLSRVFPRDSSFAPELAHLSKKHSGVWVALLNGWKCTLKMVEHDIFLQSQGQK